MAQTDDAALAALFGNFRTLAYPQPLVAEVTGASLSDLNTWRKRGLLRESEWEYSGRVKLTGRGLLLAGLMNEMAWAVGPQLAADTAWRVLTRQRWDHLPDVILTLHAGAPSGSDDPTDAVPMFGFQSDTSFREAPLSGSVVAVPLGRLARLWAAEAQRRLEPAA